MSCFIVRDETISIIAGFISYLVSLEHSLFSVDAVYPFERREAGCICDELFSLNVRAVRERYGDEVVITPYYTPSPSSGLDYTNFVSWYMVVKALDCYLYQISEGDIPEGEIYKYLVKLQKELALYIVKKNKYYNLYTWG